MRLQIGDEVWLATFDSRENFIPCPDCGGTGHIRVTFHDNTEASIGCGNCSAGYDPPTGRVRVYDRIPRAEKVYINGAEFGPKEVRWRLGHSDNCYRIADDCDIFHTEAAAMKRAQQVSDEASKAERERVLQKEKDTRSWAWNASYHRKQIKEAHRQIAYHTAKLAVAAIKAKEPPA